MLCYWLKVHLDRPVCGPLQVHFPTNREEQPDCSLYKFGFLQREAFLWVTEPTKCNRYLRAKTHIATYTCDGAEYHNVTWSNTPGNSSADIMLRVSTPCVMRLRLIPGALVRIATIDTYALTASNRPTQIT